MIPSLNAWGGSELKLKEPGVVSPPRLTIAGPYNSRIQALLGNQDLRVSASVEDLGVLLVFGP